MKLGVELTSAANEIVRLIPQLAQFESSAERAPTPTMGQRASVPLLVEFENAATGDAASSSPEGSAHNSIDDTAETQGSATLSSDVAIAPFSLRQRRVMNEQYPAKALTMELLRAGQKHTRTSVAPAVTDRTVLVRLISDAGKAGRFAINGCAGCRCLWPHN
jgi:hypothetical protein